MPPIIRKPSVTLVYTGIVVRGVTDFDIQAGSEFSLILENVPNLIRFEDWFTNNDPVLYVVVAPDGKSAKVSVRAAGSCAIKIQGVGDIKINVFGEKATGFSVTAGPKELKK